MTYKIIALFICKHYVFVEMKFRKINLNRRLFYTYFILAYPIAQKLNTTSASL